MILITRPEPEASEYKEELEQAGYECLLAPMLEFKARGFIEPDFSVFKGLIFTSRAGVRFFCEACSFRDFPVFCVGEKTAEVARQYGFKEVHFAEGFARDILPLVRTYVYGGEHFLHIRGVHVAYDLEDDFVRAGMRLSSLIVYVAEKNEVISEDAIEKITAGLVKDVIFFSRRTALNFLDIAKKYDFLPALEGMRGLCISQGVVECVRAAKWDDVLCAAKPDRHAVAALLEKK